MSWFKSKFSMLETTIEVSQEIALTAFRHEDAANLVLYLNDPEIAKNTLTVPFPYTEKNAAEWFDFIKERDKHLGWQTQWAIRHQTAGCIGGIGVFAKEGRDGHLDEIGYWMGEPFRGKGYTSAAVRAFSAFQMGNRPSLVRLQAFVFSFNPASMRVLEKAGYQREGYIPKLYRKNGEYYDAIPFGLLREAALTAVDRPPGNR